MSIDATYAEPGVQIIQGAPPTFPPPNANSSVVMMLGRAPKGTRHLTYCTAAQAQSIYGTDGGNLLTGNFGSSGYDLPTAIRLCDLQRNPSGRTPITYLIGRVGVVPATHVLLDRTGGTPIPAINLAGEGPYAGTNGVNLAVGQIVLDGSMNVTLIDIVDISAGEGNPVLLQRYNSVSSDLSTNTAICAAINGNNPVNSSSSIVSASVATGNPTTPAAVASPVGFTTGSPNDGKAATWTDATVAGLLTESLSFPVDWAYFGFDAAACAAGVQANQELTLNNSNNFYRAALGALLGTTYASLSTTYINAITGSERVSLMMNDGVFVINPTTGASQAMSGWMLAAIFIGIKAAGVANDAAINAPLLGISGIVPSVDNNGRQLTPAQRATLALPTGSTSQAGGIVAWQDPADNSLKFIDTLTTAPYTVNGGINIFRQMFATHVNDGFNTAVARATAPYIGRGTQSVTQLQQTLSASMQTETAKITGSGVSKVQITTPLDPNTGQPAPNAAYALVSPLLNANISTSFVLATS